MGGDQEDNVLWKILGVSEGPVEVRDEWEVLFVSCIWMFVEEWKNVGAWFASQSTSNCQSVAGCATDSPGSSGKNDVAAAQKNSLTPAPPGRHTPNIKQPLS